MKLPAKNKIKISLLLPVLLLVFLFANISVAKADTISDLTSGVATFVHFVVQGFTDLRNNLCNQYVSTSSQSSFDQFKINLQKTFCSGYIPATSAPAEQTASSSTDIFSIFSIPGMLAPNAMPDISTYFTDFSTTPSSDNNSVIATNTDTLNINNTQTNALSTTTETVSLPGGLSGSTEQNGVSLNDGQIIYWTNIERNNNGGLSPLAENNVLDKIAAIRVEDMFTKQYFDHYSPTGDNVSLEANANGYSYITIGENIAEGNFGSSRDLVNAWMASPGHRANILNTKYTEIGVAAEEGMYQGSEVWIASQAFGEPLSDCPGPDASIKQQISADQTQATDLMAQITSAKAQLAADSGDPTAYNAQASVYNNLATEYNNLIAETKTLASQYNQQVAVFNACIK